MIENEDTNEEEIIDLTTEEEIKDFTDSINIDSAFNYPVINSPTITGGAKLNLGSGNKCFKFQADKGIWLGHTDYASAPFRVDMDGAIAGSSFSLTSISGDLDDIGDGTDYSKVLTTDITAGHILLSSTTGDLGDISDGGGYGKIASTSISAGKIILTSGTGVNGSLPVANTDAKSTDPNADGTQAALTAGANIDNAKANGITLIEGGYIKTGIISATNITAGTLTGRTVQTGFPTGTNKVIRLSSTDTHLMEFMYGVDVVGKLEVLYNPANDLAGFDLTGGGGAYVAGSGKSNMGATLLGLTNKYFGLSWESGDSGTEKITTNANVDSDWTPYGTHNLGTNTDKWQHLYLSGNIVVGGTVDGVGIASHAGNVSAHHTKYTDSEARSAVVDTALGGSLYPSSTSYNLGSSSYYWGDFYFHAGGEIYVGSTTHYLRLNQRDYLTHDAVGFDNLGDVMPEGSGIWDLGGSSNRFNKIYLTNDPDVSSARELKKDIKTIKYGLEEILKLEPIEFKWKESNREGKDKKHIGLIAGDVRKIIPEIATDKSYQPTGLIPVLINSIKELNEKVEIIKDKVV